MVLLFIGGKLLIKVKHDEWKHNVNISTAKVKMM